MTAAAAVLGDVDVGVVVTLVGAAASKSGEEQSVNLRFNLANKFRT